MKWMLKISVFAFLLALICPLYAWDQIGHQLIAQIAFDNMKTSAKYRAIGLVDALRGEYGYTTFVRVSTWADDIRRHDVDAFTQWHFINQPFSPDGTPLPSLEKQNIIWAILQSEKTIQSPNAIRFEQAFFIRFLIHLIGDIHQPLHASTRVTANLPMGDSGGNLYPIRYGKIRNLHQFWDRGAGYFTAKYRYPLNPAQIKSVARDIEERYPISHFKRQAKDLNPRHWAKESFFFAKTHLYTVPPNSRPSKDYIEKSRDIVMQRIALAGYRLAAVLNFIFHGSR